MKPIHLSNAKGRDATVHYVGLKLAPPPTQGVPGKNVAFARYLATTEDGLHEALIERIGEDYHQALVEGDPEVDIERVGRRIGSTSVVYLSAAGEVLHSAPDVVEVVYAPDGSERERRPPADVPQNTQEETPLRWTGRRFKRADVVRKFVFRRTVQLVHSDGLTFDYLFEIAKDLHDAGDVVLLGAGPKGVAPLVFQTNGSPYRAFLEGRVQDNAYQLLMHLSNMELKLPEASS